MVIDEIFKGDTLLQEDVEIIEIRPLHNEDDKKKLYSIEVESEGKDRLSIHYLNYDFDVVLRKNV